MIKTIYIYWGQKFINAPKLVKKCLLSWKIKNPLWKIIELDDDNLSNYINIEDDIPNINDKKITHTVRSDIIRLSLLEKYGGCWCDATCLCTKPLDSWLNEYIQTGFFCFKQKNDRILSTWFLYSEKNNYIITKWKEGVINYVNQIDELGTTDITPSLDIWNENKFNYNHYFWCHYIFGDLYKSDIEFKNMYDNTPELYIINNLFSPHHFDFVRPITEQNKIFIKNNDNPMYKLSNRFDKSKYNKKSILYYLLNNTINLNNLKFIHIGKCGGTTISNHFKLEEYHIKKNYSDNENYIIWIRNPLKRFVSAFYFSYDIIHTDTSKLNINNLTLDNCLAPARIHYKMKHDHAYSKRYDYLINYFQNPNHLAESLTSEDENKKKLAFELMNSEHEHINKGIGWYLNNGKFIEENYNNIVFVGCIENMNDDLDKLSNILNTEIQLDKKIRENTNNHDKSLSETAIVNILNYYEKTDYKALQKLVDYHFISDELFEKYHIYK